MKPYVTVNGVWRYAYRAVDQHGQVIDVLVSTRRDAEAARRLGTSIGRATRDTSRGDARRADLYPAQGPCP
jgi:transposase-like protein